MKSKTSLDTRMQVLETLLQSIMIASRSAVMLSSDKDFQERIAEVLQAHSDALRDLSGSQHKTIGFINTRGTK
jgi:hypothetical protein